VFVARIRSFKKVAPPRRGGTPVFHYC
jgi:hypothetical protein